MPPPASPARPDDGSDWTDRRWVRALRRRRARPLGLAILGVLLLATFAPLYRGPRLALFDAYQALAPRARTADPVVIVAIDEASLRSQGQWPWPRTRLAQLVSIVLAGDPAAVGLDLVMPEPDRLSPSRMAELVAGYDPDLARRLGAIESHDATLARTLRNRPVVLSAAGVDDGNTAGAGPLHQTPVRIYGPDPRPVLRHFDAALGSIAEIADAAAGHGLVSADPEAGVLRRIPLVAAVGSAVMPSLALEMLRVAAGAPGFTVRGGPHGVESVGVGDLVIPTQADGTVWIHFSPHDIARFVSAGEVLEGRVPPARFTRKLVLIGVTAVGLSDYQTTPVAAQMAGVEIHAQLLEGLLDGDLLFRPRWARAVEAALLALGGLALVLAVPGLPVRLSLALALGLALGLLGLGFLLYAWARILLDAASPVLGLGVVYVAMLGATLAEARGQRRALRRQLQREREAAARLAGELEAARRIQMSILPDPGHAFPAERRFSVFVHLEPAREVGGDFYDFFLLDDRRLFFAIGDVSGKGLPGSLFMALSKSLCKSAALRRPGEVADVMAEANREIARDNRESMFVTAFAGILDVESGALQYCNAGHDAPFVLSGSERAPRRLTGGGGVPLCVIDGFPYEAAADQLRPGEVVCLVTDGVTDARNSEGALYGRDRLEALLAALPRGGLPSGRFAPAVGSAIRDDVDAFAGNTERADDIAILVLEWRGPGDAPIPSPPLSGC